MKSSYLLLVTIIVIISGCADSPSIKSLSNQEFINILFADDEGTGIEWSDESRDDSTGEDLIVRSSSEACGEDDCGTLRYITNTSAEKTIKSVIKYSYNAEGFPGSASREYVIPPGETVRIACTHFCYVGTSYTLSLEAINSIYLEEEGN